MSVEAELPLMCGLCGKSVSQGPSHPGELARPALALRRAEIDPDRASCSGNGKPGRQRPERGEPALDVRLEDCALPRGLEVTRPEPLGGGTRRAVEERVDAAPGRAPDAFEAAGPSPCLDLLSVRFARRQRDVDQLDDPAQR